MDLQLELDVQSASAHLPAAGFIERALTAALEGRREAAIVSLCVLDAEAGRALNARYRGRDYATNVLSFPADLPDGVDLPLLGDLAICAPVIEREAAEQGKALADHWAHMLVHGTLHLLGYDHIIEAEAEVMEALETRILAGLGIADPYAPTGEEPSNQDPIQESQVP